MGGAEKIIMDVNSIGGISKVVNSVINYDNLVRWSRPFKFIFLILSIILGLIIIYFSVATDYLYAKYFITMDEYWQYKTRQKAKKLKAAKDKLFQPKSQEFSADINDIMSAPTPEPVQVSGDEIFAYRIEDKPVSGYEWQKIFNRLETNRETNYKIAIIEADKVVNRKLDDMGVLGRNLRDKLENLPPDIIPKLHHLNKARKALDELLKNEHAMINKETAKEVIEIYQKAYSELMK